MEESRPEQVAIRDTAKATRSAARFLSSYNSVRDDEEEDEGATDYNPTKCLIPCQTGAP